MNVVFDLDGTLANCDHRLHYIKQAEKNWPLFYAACVDDAPIFPLIWLCQSLLKDGHRIEVWTGRSDEVRTETALWLARYYLSDVDRLMMRANGDHREDYVVKAEWYDARADWEKPEMIFEDRQQVVDMWRSKRVVCCQVADGKF